MVVARVDSAEAVVAPQGAKAPMVGEVGSERWVARSAGWPIN